MKPIDEKSVLGWLGTIGLMWWHAFSREEILYLLTMAVTFTTLLYNLIRIYQVVTRKRSKKDDE